MHIACRINNIEACRALIDCGASPQLRNLKNRVPGNQLHVRNYTNFHNMPIMGRKTHTPLCK